MQRMGDLFLVTARRLAAAVQNVEKDFWVRAAKRT